MKKTIFVAALFGACMLGACSEGDDVQGLNTDCSNLTGSFTATSATVTGTGTGGSTVDLLANNGVFTLALANGTFSTSYTPGSGGTPMVASGTVSASTGTNLTINQALFTNGGSGNSFNCSINGSTLTLDAPSSSYTFEGQTESSPARVRLTLNRTSSL